jgi:hypothetical protein
MSNVNLTTIKRRKKYKNFSRIDILLLLETFNKSKKNSKKKAIRVM